MLDMHKIRALIPRHQMREGGQTQGLASRGSTS
jgi:hypothetical protein